MSTKRVRGEQLYMFMDSGDGMVPIGCSTECSLNLRAATIEVSSAGGWRNFRSGRKEWNMSCSGFYFENAALPTNFLVGTKAIGTTVTVAMSILARSLVEAGIDLENISPDSVQSIMGTAIIVDCRYDGPKSGHATYTIDLQGTGEISNVE